jgi:hypothetical protein
MGERRSRIVVSMALVALACLAAITVPVPASSAAASTVGAGASARGAQFADVPASHPFLAEIAWLAGTAVTQGYDDGTFRPAAPVSRQGMAAFLHRLAGAPAVDSAPSFADVPANHPFREAIGWLAASGVTTGYGDGTFRPAAPVSRQAMAAFLHRLTGASAPGDPPSFRDVPPSHPFRIEVGWLASSGVTTGYDDGTFRPAAPVSRQAMAAFLHRLASNPLAWADGAGIGVAPPEPSDVACEDFGSWYEAEAFHRWYEPWYGDVAGLVESSHPVDGAGIPCRSTMRVTVPDSTHVLDEETAAAVTEADLGAGILRFDAAAVPPGRYQAGDVIAIPPGPAVPNGLLARVVPGGAGGSTGPEGAPGSRRTADVSETTLAVEQAAIPEAVHEGVFDAEIPLVPGAAEWTVEDPDVSITPSGSVWKVRYQPSDWPVVVEQEVELGVDLALDVSCAVDLADVCIAPGRVEWFEASVSSRVASSVEIAAAASGSVVPAGLERVELGTLRRGAMLGVVPVSLELTAYLTATGEIAVSFGEVTVGYQEVRRAGIRYRVDRLGRGLWESPTPPPDAPGTGWVGDADLVELEDVAGTLRARTGAGVRFGLYLAGIYGPYVDLRATVEAGIEVPLPAPEDFAAGVFLALDAAAGFDGSQVALDVLRESGLQASVQVDHLPGPELEVNLWGAYGPSVTDSPLQWSHHLADPPRDWDGCWSSPPAVVLADLASSAARYPAGAAGNVVSVSLASLDGSPHAGVGGLTGTTSVPTAAAAFGGVATFDDLALDPATPSGTYVLVATHENPVEGGVRTGAVWRPLSPTFTSLSPPFEVSDAGGSEPWGCLSIEPATLPAAVPSTSYSVQLTASGGTEPYAFEVVEASLPAGLSLTEGGLLAGEVAAPPAPGEAWWLRVRAVDASGRVGERTLRLDVEPGREWSGWVELTTSTSSGPGCQPEDGCWEYAFRYRLEVAPDGSGAWTADHLQRSWGIYEGCLQESDARAEAGGSFEADSPHAIEVDWPTAGTYSVHGLPVGLEFPLPGVARETPLHPWISCQPDRTFEWTQTLSLLGEYPWDPDFAGFGRVPFEPQVGAPTDCQLVGSAAAPLFTGRPGQLYTLSWSLVRQGC